ncbi:hypothetical protein ACFQL7_26735 [Halocatena marina]|uniref:Uncharacterized protein n=1 Tax=Halocatena marina TaxID=2934937 RepID=A0ABD5YXM8_9EURY
MGRVRPHFEGGEHVVFQQEGKFKVFEQRYHLGSCRIQEVAY